MISRLPFYFSDIWAGGILNHCSVQIQFDGRPKISFSISSQITYSNFYDPNDGENCLQRSLRNKAILVALDDVDDKEHIAKLIGMGNWLGPGSRAIITTRNLSCIADLKESLQGDKIYMHEMRELNFDDYLQLFSLHAFSQRVPPYGYRELLLNILSFARGIPLALEVIGSNLRWKSQAIWKEMLRKLKKVPHERLYQEILMSSYETLSDEAKEVFLDIVFFLSGHDRTTAFHYWEACDLFPAISIDTLVSYALVKINYHDKFWMHDLLIDLGREVVRKQGREKLGTRSRLCNEDAKRLLSKGQGTEEVKALKLKSAHAHIFTPFDLFRLSGLRFLELCRGNFVGEFDGCLSELRWLSWCNCPSDFQGKDLNLENLVVLKLSWSNIADGWAGWEQLEVGVDHSHLWVEWLLRGKRKMIKPKSLFAILYYLHAYTEYEQNYHACQSPNR